MIVANFFHLKNTNGLYYYGVDYLRELRGSLRKFLVRESMAVATQRSFPDCEVVVCTSVSVVAEVARAARRGDFIYVPSSHPMPFISNQMVVVHDIYPMQGKLGRIKKLLLQISLFSSSCHLGYINDSVMREFGESLGINKERLIFAPNKFPDASAKTVAPLRTSARTIVGLFGTDSSKKNYAQLFAALTAAGDANRVNFRLYGHRTSYYEALVAKYPQIHAELVESDSCSIPEFFSSVDLIVSVADHEGFGRPIAGALLAGIPTLLMARPVFLEFFQGGAEFASDIASVVSAMVAFDRGAPRNAVSYRAAPHAVAGFASAVAFLRKRAIGAN